MTQEFVTLPRGVVEHALDALWTAATPKAEAAIAALRSALDQPQANQPAMTPIAQRKLDSLLAEGYTISGYSVYHERKHQHGFVTGAGLVGWWRPDGVEYPQPQGELEPVAKVVLTEQLGLPCLQWLDLDKQFDFNGGEFLYTSQQPKREPLTDEQIADIVIDMNGNEPTALFWRDLARAIEVAHNIK